MAQEGKIMQTSFGETSSARAQALREIRDNLVADAERTAAHASSELLAQASRSLRFHRFGEEREMPLPTRNYLGICCGYGCLRSKILFIKARHPDAVIDIGSNTITVGSDRFIFLITPENDHRLLMSIELTAYRTCSRYVLSAELRDRLATRIRQR
jgi:hypothetical protein